jgi:hypothetical protein
MAQRENDPTRDETPSVTGDVAEPGEQGVGRPEGELLEELHREQEEADRRAIRDATGEGHATTSGAAVAGAVAGAAVGLTGGPVGAVVGALGGAIVGAVTERVMHGDRPPQEIVDPSDLGRSDLSQDVDGSHHPDVGYATMGGSVPAGAGLEEPAPAREWERIRARYRAMWDRKYGSGGRSWEDDERSYRWAWERRQEARFRDLEWARAEPALREEWARWSPTTHWEAVCDDVREMWESDWESEKASDASPVL